MKNLALILALTLTASLSNAANSLTAGTVGARSCDAKELNADGSLNVQNFIDLFGYGQGPLRQSGNAGLERTVSIQEYLATPHIEGLAKDVVTLLTFHSEASRKLPGFTKGITSNTSKVREYGFDSRMSRQYESYSVALVGANGSSITCSKTLPEGLTAESYRAFYTKSFVRAANGDHLKLPTAEAFYNCQMKGSLTDLSSNLNKVLDEVYAKTLNKEDNFYLHITVGSRGRPEAALTQAISSSRKTVHAGDTFTNCNLLLTCENSRCTFEPSAKLMNLTK